MTEQEQQEWIERKAQEFVDRILARSRNKRVRCNAKTRPGHPCRMKSEPGKTRCKFHGGRSTGPKTPEGRARIAKAQKRRWAAWRAAQGA